MGLIPPRKKAQRGAFAPRQLDILGPLGYNSRAVGTQAHKKESTMKSKCCGVRLRRITRDRDLAFLDKHIWHCTVCNRQYEQRRRKPAKTKENVDGTVI